MASPFESRTRSEAARLIAERWANEVSVAGVVHFFEPLCYRSEFGAKTEAEACERALRYLECVVSMEGPDTIAAIVLETIPGTAGVLLPPDG